jgi:hypothetical protein
VPKRTPITPRGADAFFSDDPIKQPEAQPDSLPVHQQASTPVEQPRQAPITDAPEMVKATFYLDRDSAELLDEYWLGQRKHGGLSKSELVRKAIRLLVQQ